MSDDIHAGSPPMQADQFQRRVMPPVPRPLGTTLVAWGFILMGGHALLSMLRHLLHGGISIHVGALLLPVALGLLRGQVFAIRWARIQAGFMMALGGFALLLYPFFGAGYNVSWFGRQLQGLPRHVFVVSIGAITVLLGVAIWRAVSGPAHLAYVAAKEGFPAVPETKERG